MDAREESHDLDLVTVFQSAGTTSEMEALSVQSLLEASGIAAVVVGAQSLPNLPEEVRVAKEHETEAKRIIADALAAGACGSIGGREADRVAGELYRTRRLGAMAYPDTLPMASDPEHPQQQYDWKHTARGMVALAAVYCAVVYLIPKPAAVKPEGWRLTGIFIATIAGSVIQPIPGGALVLLAVTLAAIFGGLTVEQALAGYADKTVWLVMAAFFISRALINTGLARRIALFFVRMFGKSSLGVSYALALSDLVLAGVIPSNGARSGGVILPIVRSIAELYGSKPGATAALLGSFLMPAVYQSVCVTSAMFYTGQASNPLAAQDRSGIRLSGHLGELD